MKRIFVCFSICLIIVINNNVLSTEKPFGYLNLLSPQTYDFTKYGNMPVNHFTGETNVQIPIYTYKDRDFDFPIYIGYNSSGFIPNKREGIVGLNWYMNAGGVITRQVNGWPDEQQGVPSAILHGHYYGIKNNLEVKLKTTPEIFGFTCGQINTSELWNIAGCEVEPDDFTVTMPGHNGRFFIQNDGEVHCIGNKAYKVDLSLFNIQLAYATELNSSQIVITTDDGFKYYFGGSLQYLEVSYPLDIVTQTIGHPVINAWHLSKIVAPNGREAVFSYETFTEGIIDKLGPEDNTHYLLNRYQFDQSSSNASCIDFPLSGGFCLYTSSGTETIVYETTKTVYLKKITIGQSSIEFGYSEKANKFYLNENSPFNQKNMQLNSIYIKYGSNTLKTYTLGYNYLGGSYGSRQFLTSMQEAGSNAFTFSYYQTTEIPSPKTISIDYWGFWKGGYNESGSLMPAIIYKQNGDIEYTDDKRAPNASKCNVGLLEKITHPTGGYTIFYYEGHKYSKRLERRNATNFLPLLFSVTGDAGGARIWKIVDSDGANETNTREFKYTRNYPSITTSSGILLDWPRCLFYWEYHNGSTNTYSVRKQSSSFNMNYYPGEKYIQYAEVTEIAMPSNGYINYKFTNYETNPDISDYNTSVVSNDYQQHVANINLYNSFDGIRFNDRSFERGIAKEVTEYSNQNGTYGIVKKSLIQQFTGLTDYPNSYIVGVLQTGALAQSYKVYYYPYLPKLIDNISYDANGSATTVTKSFNYNNSNKISQETLTLSDNSILSIINKYPTEYTSISNPVPLQIMRNKNMVNSIIEQQEWTNSKLTSATFYQYNNFGTSSDIPLLKNIYQLETNNPLANNEFIGLDAYGELRTGTQYKLNTTLNYDNNNLTLIIQQKANDIPISYIWGYNNLQPIIKAQNASNSALNTALTSALSAVGYTSLDNLLTYIGDLSTSAQQSKWSLFNSSLRNNSNLSNSFIYTYSYSPLIGITSETDPNSKTSYYLYDSFGRLLFRKDQDLNIIQEYKYHYKE